MSGPAWRWAIRVARRDAWRHRGRSLLVIVLVGFPVLVVTVVAVLHRTYQLDPTTDLERRIGHADARVQWYPYAHLQQDLDGSGLSWSGSGAPPPRPSTSKLRALLPAGSRVIEYRQAPQPVHFIGTHSAGSTPLTGLDYADPLAAGIVHQVSGRAPRSSTEVAVTARTADDNGIAVGDRLRLYGPNLVATVVGIVEPASETNDPGIFTVPAAVPVPPGAHDEFGAAQSSLSWLVGSPRPITWPEVQRWNRAGFVTTSRSVLVNPPALRAQRYVDSSSSGLDPEDTAAAALVAGMALLEIALLAGPAFAVTARRKQRELALIGAVGGSRADLRRVVLVDALGLGVLAGVVGAGLGIGVAAGSYEHVARVAGSLPGPFTVPWLQVLGLAAIATVAALAAAFLPALRTGRMDVVPALAGRVPTEPLRARVPTFGIILAVLGVLIAVGAGRRNSTAQPVVIVAGVALLEVGLIIATPALLRATGRLSGVLPLAVRIAVRDASRHRTAAVPAVAAVMAATIGATAALVGVASRDADQGRFYEAQLPLHDSYVSVAGNPRQAGAVEAALRQAFPGHAVTVVQAPQGLCRPDSIDEFTSPCVSIMEGRDTDSRAVSSTLPSVLVADGARQRDVDALFGRSEPGAGAALRAGRVVTVPATLPASGRRSTTLVAAQGGSFDTSSPRATVDVTVVRSGFPPAQYVIPPAVAARLGLRTQAVGVLVSNSHAPSAAERRTLAAGLAPLGLDAVTDNGPTTSHPSLELAIALVAALVAVVAALVATALANGESRPELRVLSALGAAPTTRRGISAARALTIAGLGTAIGTVAGLLPSSAWAKAVSSPVDIPWAFVLATMLGIPLIAGGLAWICSRSRFPSERPA